MDDLEQLWQTILSCDPARIRRVWSELTDDECLAVLAHLRRMQAEAGWDSAQRDSAAVALEVLRQQAD